MTQAVRFARSIVIVSLVITCFAQIPAADRGPSGFYLVAVDDCGNPAREAHLVEGRDGEIPDSSAPGASEEERTISEGRSVVYRYSGLPLAERYKLRIVYLSNRTGQAVRITAGGVELQTRLEEPEHEARKREMDVPAAAIPNGVLELKFEPVGKGVVSVSLIELWSTSGAASQNLQMQAGGDSRGEITGTVTDWLNRPVAGSSIRVQAPKAASEIGATTDSSGRFSIRVPSAWRSFVREIVSVQASRGGFTTSAAIHLAEIFPPDVRLTPVPATVPGLDKLKLDLGGAWNFTVQPPARFWEQGAVPPAGIHRIQVPGEWAMQGFSVPKGGAAGYWRTVEIPPEWTGKAIKLKCDAAFSLAEVWVNGQKLGEAEGGFTPFEFDATSALKGGRHAVVAVRVEQDTMAARLSAMINYVQHDLGGITRKIYLSAVPEVNVFRFHIETRFDSQYRDATLRLTVGVTNQSASRSDGAEVRLRLMDPEENEVALTPGSVRFPALPAGAEQVQIVNVPVTKPAHWENEHPRLYRLYADLLAGGAKVEGVERRFGFRQVEIRGNELLLNGQGIKLRGVERHETNPVLGRSLQPQMWKQDAQLLHEANMNYVFTSHYPVPEEFLDACDEVGLLVTEELPSVWVGWRTEGDAPEGSNDPSDYQTMATIAATTLEKDRSHPSILFWQICDECIWGRNFAGLMSLFETADPSRPVNFSYEAGTSKFFSQHYPSLEDARKAAPAGRKPVIYDQYAHINNYNRREHFTDPGVRDYYGRVIGPMWDVMYANPGIAGGAIWEWSDDVFYVPPSGHNGSRFQGYLDPKSGRWQVGYGQWGIVDSWLRKKPEFWNVKKAYSPVRIEEHQPIPSPTDGLLCIPVENRYDFTNLDELRIEWSAGAWHGAATANVPPRAKGVVEISLPQGASEVHDLTLKFFNRGELVDAYILPVGNSRAPAGEGLGTAHIQAPQLEQTEKHLIIRGSEYFWDFDRQTGLLVSGGRPGAPAAIVGGPALAVTPLELAPFSQISGRVDALQPPVMKWTASGVSAQIEGSTVLIAVTGSYPLYQGGYTLRVDGAGSLTLNYRFEYGGPAISVREVGLLFDIPADVDTLSWKHKTQWSYYPDGHIGRPEGSAPAFRSVLEWPRAIWGQTPPWPWELDSTAGGTNDFRSTKYNILWASLADCEGRGVRAESDGRQSARAWVEEDRIKFLISDFSNGGSEVFLRQTHFTHEQRTLRKGDIVSGSVRLVLAGKSGH